MNRMVRGRVTILVTAVLALVVSGSAFAENSKTPPANPTTWYYVLILIGGALVVLWLLTFYFVKTGKITGKEWLANALGIPDGSVRALLALLILLFVIWAAINNADLSSFPEWAVGILGTVVGFYFGAQSISSAQQQQKQSPTVSTSSLPDGKVGDSYSTSLAAVGLASPAAWAISKGSLPNGLTLNPATGMISGMPTSAGAFAITVSVSDGLGAVATKSFSFNISS